MVLKIFPKAVGTGISDAILYYYVNKIFATINLVLVYLSSSFYETLQIVILVFFPNKGKRGFGLLA